MAWTDALLVAIDGADHRAATLVGIGGLGVIHHLAPGPRSILIIQSSSQKCSLRYLSALSQRMVTITPSLPCARNSLRDGQRGHDIAAARDSDEQAFFPRQALDHRMAVFRFDPHVAVGQLLVVDAGDDRGRHVFRAFDAVEAGRRLRGDAFDVRQILAQAAGVAGESPAGAEQRDEMRDAAFGLLDDFPAPWFRSARASWRRYCIDRRRNSGRGRPA